MCGHRCNAGSRDAFPSKCCSECFCHVPYGRWAEPVPMCLRGAAECSDDGMLHAAENDIFTGFLIITRVHLSDHFFVKVVLDVALLDMVAVRC
jgi:hypothetical protein